jgi:hypothetical protein
MIKRWKSGLVAAASVMATAPSLAQAQDAFRLISAADQLSIDGGDDSATVQWLNVASANNELVGNVGIVHLESGETWIQVSDGAELFECEIAADGFASQSAGLIDNGAHECQLPSTIDPRILDALRVSANYDELAPIGYFNDLLLPDGSGQIADPTELQISIPTQQSWLEPVGPQLMKGKYDRRPGESVRDYIIRCMKPLLDAMAEAADGALSTPPFGSDAGGGDAGGGDAGGGDGGSGGASGGDGGAAGSAGSGAPSGGDAGVTCVRQTVCDVDCHDELNCRR